MKSVLVIDDDPGVRTLTTMFLQREEYEVLTAANGRDGLETLQSYVPSVIVLDLKRPVMDGKAFFREIDGPSRPPVIILSAYGAAEACRELGAEECIAKPFEPQELTAAVNRLQQANPQNLTQREADLVTELSRLLKDSALTAEAHGGSAGQV